MNKEKVIYINPDDEKSISRLRRVIKIQQKTIEELIQENEEYKKRLQISNAVKSAPSGTKVVFLKPEIKKRKKKNPGRKKGHKGASRPKPKDEEITDEVDHTLEMCPDCNGKVYPANSTRTRIIVDIVMESETTKHTISSHWCPRCKSNKEDIITDALPGFTIGNKTLVYSALQHFTQGVSLSNIVRNLNYSKLKLTSGCLINGWHKLAEILTPYYDDILEKTRKSEATYADETGWRQKGKRFWLWGFFTKTTALYTIRRKRDKNVVIEILGDTFDGILITDFWKPYSSIAVRFHQWCIAHFLREFIKIGSRRKKFTRSYLKFRKAVKRLFTEALNYNKKVELTKEDRERRKKKFLERIDKVTKIRSRDPDVIRLQNRLTKYKDGMFTFITEDVDPTNNFSERMIRCAVLLRKIGFHTMSEKGSETLSILLSVFKTMEMQGLDPYTETLKIVQNYIIQQKKSGKMDLAA